MADQRRFHEGEQHPEEWREDLNPDNMAGVNYGREGLAPEVNARTAFQIKELHESLEGFSDDELRQITVLPEGSRLEHGATYVDLSSVSPEEFTATAEMEAGGGSYIAPKSMVDYQLWNRLIGIENPVRTGRMPADRVAGELPGEK